MKAIRSRLTDDQLSEHKKLLPSRATDHAYGGKREDVRKALPKKSVQTKIEGPRLDTTERAYRKKLRRKRTQPKGHEPNEQIEEEKDQILGLSLSGKVGAPKRRGSRHASDARLDAN